MSSYLFRITVLVIATLLVGTQAFADGAVVDKVYDPYVHVLERELEYRVIVQNDDSDILDDFQIHRLGFGVAWAERWFSELYVIGQKTSTDSLSVKAYEFETKWQLTEQGEYWADWGLLIEVERERHGDAWEVGTTVLISKELGRWVTTMNAGLIYEWIDDVGSEWETTLAIQGRYRLSRGFEPALEFYSGENTRALGPAFVGDIRAGGRKKLHWEVGLIFGLDSDSPDTTFRGLLEFEF